MESYIETNNLMHEDRDVRDKFSGTTAISAIFYGNKVTVGNAGDSRAVLGTDRKSTVTSDNENNLDLEAIPLSRDQTPYRKDELIRVRKAGARVLTVEQLQKNSPEPEEWSSEEVNYDGDVPRIWLQTKERPGTAFTRSLGDEVAETIGVIATPEMLTRELSSNDRILVLASDGIFDFFTSQQVIDICKKHDDPLDACKDMLAQSYGEWLKYENRVDDITAIVMFLD